LDRKKGERSAYVGTLEKLPIWAGFQSLSGLAEWVLFRAKNITVE